jgi:putative phage-type endonuclease
MWKQKKRRGKMKLINLQQRSEEWLEFRKMRIGASDCAPIMGKSEYRTARKLWREKMYGEKVYVTQAMQDGIDYEDEVRQLYCEKVGRKFEPVVALSDYNSWQMASLDGYDPDSGDILEIKTVKAKSFENAKKGIISTDYEWQAQHQLAVFSGSKKVILLFATRDGSGSFDFHQMTIFRDEDMIADLTAKERLFYTHHMLGFNEPAATSDDKEVAAEREDAEWYALSCLWSEVVAEEKELKQRKEALRQKFIEMAGGRPSKGYGVSVSYSNRPGSIDYDSIPELNDVDLEAYRKPSSVVWSVR